MDSLKKTKQQLLETQIINLKREIYIREIDILQKEKNLTDDEKKDLEKKINSLSS